MKALVSLFAGLVLLALVFVKGNEKNNLEVSAWVPWWREETVIASLDNQKDKLKTIMPVWYHIDPSGELIEVESQRKAEVMSRAFELGIVVMPTISNAEGISFDPERISLLLESVGLQEKLNNSLVELAQTKGYAGWDLDWEEVREEDKERYTDYVRRLGKLFDKHGLVLSVSVHAQTGIQNEWQGTKGQDLGALAEGADLVRIMAYDFHYSSSEPGPVTPVDKLMKVLEHSISVIPLEKLVVALPTYGYDWPEDGVGSSIQYDEAQNLVKDYKINITRDADSKSLTGKYSKDGLMHTIWYEDGESLKYKIDKVGEFGVYQVSLWHLGGEDPNIWERLQ